MYSFKNLVQLVVSDVKNIENQADTYALILKEAEGIRTIPILIGWSEARSLVLMMDKAIFHRPSIHDLFVALASHTKIHLDKVYIYKYEEGIYYAYLIMNDMNDNIFEIDSRTSDAVTLALAFHASIFIEEDILHKMSFTEKKVQEKNADIYYYSTNLQETNSIEDIPDNIEHFIGNQLKKMNLDELETLKEGAIESEDFELAARIQEEIDRRS